MDREQVIDSIKRVLHGSPCNTFQLLRDVLAFIEQSPDWHDRPTGPGRWMVAHLAWRSPLVSEWSQKQVDNYKPVGEHRFFGPIPDMKGE